MDKATITRVVAFILAWLNTGLANFGYDIPGVNEAFISVIAAAVVSVWVGWKDNPVTKEAISRKKKEVYNKNQL